MANEPVDGMAAANTMLDFGTWRRGHCLEAVWQAYKRNGARDINGQADPTAYDAWLHTDEADRRGGSFATIPAGVPVWFGPKKSSRAGDVVISIGGGMCVATDIPGRPGVIGVISLADRQRQISRPYLGWSTTILDWPIDFSQSGGDSGGGSASEEEEEPMFVNIQGKAGVRSGGPYYIEDGKATFIGGPNLSGVPTLDYDQGTKLAGRVKGIAVG
jgi:hypothetical protein